MPISLAAPFRCLTMLSLLLLVGCESSNIAARRQAHVADYAALTAGDKALVDRGQLRQGMSTNAVLIAWGQPTFISTIPHAQRAICHLGVLPKENRHNPA